MLEYERLIGGIEERIRLMTRGKLYRKLRKGGFQPSHNHSSEIFERPRDPSQIPHSNNYTYIHENPESDWRDERPTINDQKSWKQGYVKGYVSPTERAIPISMNRKNYQIPQSNTPLTHSRLSLARTPVSGMDADHLGEVVGMVVPSVISYVKHYLRENSVQKEQTKIHDKIKLKRNQDLARSLDQSPGQLSRTDNQHKRSGSFGARTDTKTPCSSCSAVKERLTALEQALQLNNARSENPYREPVGFESQFVATTPKGFSSRLKKSPLASSKRTKKEGVSTEKKSIVHSLSSRSQSRKSIKTDMREAASPPPPLKSSLITPSNYTSVTPQGKKKKVSLKLPSAAKKSRETSKKSSPTEKSQKAKEKSTDSKPASKSSRAKAKPSKTAVLGKTVVKKGTKSSKSQLCSSKGSSGVSRGQSKEKRESSVRIATGNSQQRKAVPVLAHSLLLDSRLSAVHPRKLALSAKSAVAPQGLLRPKPPTLPRSALPQSTKHRTDGLLLSAVSKGATTTEDGVVRRLHTVSSRTGSASNTPVSRGQSRDRSTLK